jgi:transcriptional regulator with XRE-family HTH domain
MAVGESPAAARHRLRRALRHAREAKQLTQRQVADSLDWSLSKVNRIEAGEVTISTTDLHALLQLLEVTDAERVEALIEDARTARRRGWWDRPEYREHLTPAIIQAIQFDAEATAISAYQPTFIPGFLQMPAYAAALMDLWSDQLSEADRTIRVDVRTMRREHLFARPEPPDYRLILDEAVLLRAVGGPAVMSEQLYNLLEQARSSPITVRILPLKHVTAYTIGGLFVIYTVDDEDVALYREGHFVDDLTYSSEEIGRHRRVFQRIWQESMPAESSLRLIEAHAAEMRSALDMYQAERGAGQPGD